MKVHHVLICFFFFTLQAGNIGVFAGRRILTGTEGGDITVACSFMLAEDRKFLCKQKCEEGVLIETTGDRDENGRYKVEYSKTVYLSYPVLYVTITRLSKSDAGRYVCGLGKPLLPDSQEHFELIVKDASPTMLSSSSSSSASPEITEQTERGTTPLGSAPNTSKPSWTLQTFPTSASTPTMTQHLNSSSVSSTSSSASPETTEPSEQQQAERAKAPLGSAPNTSKPNWTLQTFPTSASTPTMTQHLNSSSVSFTPSSASPETTEPSEQQQAERATARLGSWNLLYVGFTLLIMMAVLLVLGLLFRASRRKEYVMNARYTQGRYIEQNGDHRATENQATEDSNTTALLHSAPTGNSSDVNYSDANNMEASPPL